MCGIFGYVGSDNSVEICLQGLSRLEYRGYDSAGMAGTRNGKLIVSKVVGNIAKLEAQVISEEMAVDCAIAHTRWATHGVANLVNAHPHLDAGKTLAVVHNGIIENEERLREELKRAGCHFRSDTDTEVVAQLIATLYKGNLLEAVQKAVAQLHGSYALAVVHKDFPKEIIAVAEGCPLAVGIGTEEVFLSSDTNAFSAKIDHIFFLANKEVAVLTPQGATVYDKTATRVSKQTQKLEAYGEESSKGDYEHYTLKEIFEQPHTIRRALLSRYLPVQGISHFEELTFSREQLLSFNRILILGCGTSWHAGCIAAYLLEDLARIPTQVEISSEFRYKNPIVSKETLVIAISQSGETADTLAAIKELKAKGAAILAICNVQGSSLTREADCTLFLKAGAEVGVCSTKAFTSQLIVLYLLTLLFARMRHMSQEEGIAWVKALKALPEQVEEVLKQAPLIEALADEYAHYQNFFFLGRRELYPTALEGALKLKEISYINANGYPAGELKHGPIALINEECPTVAFCNNKATYSKLLSNLKEVKARHGKVIAIVDKGAEGLDSIANARIEVPATIDPLAPILSSVAAQLFAYYVARKRGAEIDRPRNLAKSVTVE